MVLFTTPRSKLLRLVCLTALGTLVAESDPARAQSYSLAKTLLRPTASAGAEFGYSIAAVGTQILVGARRDGDTGAAYLFDGDPRSPTFGQVLHVFSNPTPAAGDQFGASVAAIGSDFLIADISDDTGTSNAGAAYLFDGATYALKHPFLGPNPGKGDLFGESVTAARGNVLVGARFDDGGAQDAGAAHLFDSATGVLLKTFRKPTPAAGDLFGTSLAGVGSDVVIGASDDDTAAGNAGAAYLFDADPSSPSFGALRHTFFSPTPVESGEFGLAVAAVGPNVLISALNGKVGPAQGDEPLPTNAGIAYLFDGNPASPTFGMLLHIFLSPSPQEQELFGFAVTAMGTQVLIGAPSEGGARAAYLFDGDPSSPTFGMLLATFREPAPAAGSRFGFAVAAMDGGVVVGNHGDQTAAPDAGAVYLFDLCGNGVATAGEQCDRGGTDCCSSSCSFEPAGSACTDDDVCTDDRCDGSGTCLHTANTAPCDDGDACTTVDACSGGECMGDLPPSCDDGTLCTADACVPPTGCTHTPIPGCCTADTDCDDGDPCTGSETCDTGTGICRAGIPPTCDDGNACNGVETCDSEHGGCRPAEPPDCDDGRVCTRDACDPATGCSHEPIPGCCTADADCDDHDACDGRETCDPSTGLCRPGEALVCDDADVCDGEETCDAGAGCVAGTPLVCDDGDACNGVETCDALVGCVPSATTVSFESVDCRLVVLSERVRTSVDTGRLQTLLLNYLTKAEVGRARAHQLLEEGHQRRAAGSLRLAIRKLVLLRDRLGSVRARRTISDDIRAGLLAVDERVLTETRTLLEAITVQGAGSG